jgi:WhiB family redox-sensing transcriptional regulator
VTALFAVQEQPWREKALCAGLSPDIFYLQKEVGKSNGGLLAKKVCGGCEVAHECLTFAVSNHEEYGIWGGCGGARLRALNSIWSRKRDCDGYGWRDGCPCEWCTTLDRVIVENAVLNANGDGATHGIRTTYARSCRCFACRLAASMYTAEKRGAA